MVKLNVNRVKRVSVGTSVKSSSEKPTKERKKSMTKTSSAKKTTKKSTKKKQPVDDGDLSQVIERLQRTYGEEIYRDFRTQISIPVIPTGSIVVDRVIGIGGIPRGRFVEFCGWESTGKTTLALQTMRCAVEDGVKCAFLDFEQSMTPSLANSMGLEFNKKDCVLFQPPSFEAGEVIIEELLSREFGLIILDSIPAMVPTTMQEADVGKGLPLGLHAKMIGNLFKKLVSRIHQTQTTILCINHVRQDIRSNSSWGPPTITTPGGATARYLYSVRLYLQVVSKVRAAVDETDPALKDKDGQVPVFNLVRVTAEKNKLGTPYLQGEFALVYGKGVDNAYTILDVGKKLGVIKQAGSWVSYEDEDNPEYSFKVQGEHSAREHLNSNPDLLNYLADKLDLVHEKNKPSIWVPGQKEQQAVERGSFTRVATINDLEEV